MIHFKRFLGVYALFHHATEAASKAKFEFFENNVRFVLNISLVPKAIPVPPQYTQLQTKFLEALATHLWYLQDCWEI